MPSCIHLLVICIFHQNYLAVDIAVGKPRGYEDVKLPYV